MKKKYIKILNKLEEINPDAVVLQGLDACVIGICNAYNGAILLYSENKIIKRLMKDMTEEDAIKYYSNEILNIYHGLYSPVFLVSKNDIK